jgi:DNA polymerase-4
MRSTASILHLDLDAFFAAVEQRDKPSLRGKPVIVGGTGGRGVVSTASYEARGFGVGSGMPLRTAFRKCPEAVFLPVDKPAYDAASADVMSTLRSFAVPVEVLGWDEAFLAVSTDVPEGFAHELRAAVLERTRLHGSVGIGDNKLQAKIATDFGKPRGVHRLTSEDWFEQLGDRPTDALWGIGRKTARKLAELGVHTVRELAAADTQMLADRLGPTMGPWYRRLGRGVDSSPVDPTPYVARGHGRETTFGENQSNWAAVAATVRALAEQVTGDLAAEGRAAVRVGMKLRYAPFETRTRSRTLPAPTSDPAVITEAALGLLDRFDHSRSVRLVGVRAEMEEPLT